MDKSSDRHPIRDRKYSSDECQNICKTAAQAAMKKIDEMIGSADMDADRATHTRNAFTMAFTGLSMQLAANAETSGNKLMDEAEIGNIVSAGLHEFFKMYTGGIHACHAKEEEHAAAV